MLLVIKGWLEGPFKYDRDGSLRKGGEAVAENSAFRFGVQQADELRAVGDLRRSFIDDSTCAHPPVIRPLWDHAVQICEFYDFNGDHRPLAMAKADDAGAY